jgi:SNF2 family DNA or RNA helicase
MALLADMGTGKTGAAVNILRIKYGENKRVMKTIILSPLVTLFNWKDEFFKHSYIDNNLVHPIYGTTAQKLKKFERAMKDDENCIIIVNYEAMIAPKFLEAVKKWNPEIMLLDEAHYCKSHKSKRSKAIYDLSVGCKHRYIMTGTPMTNNVTDLFMQYKILDGGETFGNNFYVFQRTYMRDANAAWSHMQKHFPKWVAREDKMEEINAKVYSKAIRVTKDETLDLPPLINETYKVPLSPKQKKYYDNMERDFLTFVEEGEKKGIAVAQLAVTKALKLQQIVTGFITDDDGELIEIKDNPRLKAVEELVSALHEQHKVILWCSFIHNYKQLGELMTKMKIKHKFITGAMNLKEKRDAMESFNNDDETRVIICNRKAGGIGINLVSASYSIVYSRNFSLEEELQSRDRNYRGGSEIHDRIVRINLCAEDTTDERITEALINKKKVSDNILEYIRRK